MKLPSRPNFRDPNNSDDFMSETFSSNLLLQRNGNKGVGSAATDTKTLQTPGKPGPVIQKEYAELRTAYDNLSKELRDSRNEIKRLQEQDFAARRRDRTESHDNISRQFLDIFRMSEDWARDYFKIDFRSFCLDEHELFKKHLRSVLWDESGWMTKKKLNVRHLVQAVLADMIAHRILLAPFGGCAKGFRHENNHLYEEMLKGDRSVAHQWRATTLAQYERCKEWPPSSVDSKPITWHRKTYYQEIAKEIDSIFGPIAQRHFPERINHDERFNRSMVFIEAAGELALMLGKQAAELEVIDKSWFEGKERMFICDDERMRGRFSEEDEDSETYLVDIILRPGFLKCGNDEGGNPHQYAVWIPAMLDLRDSTIQAENHAPADAKPGNLENDNATTLDTLPKQAPPSQHHEQTVSPSHKEPVGNGACSQEQVHHPPLEVRSEPQSVSRQPISRDQTLDQIAWPRRALRKVKKVFRSIW